jgi:hypothetical protein
VNGSRDEISGTPIHSHALSIMRAMCNSDEPSSRFAKAAMTTRPEGDPATASTHKSSTPARVGSGGNVHFPAVHLRMFGPLQRRLSQISPDPAAASVDSAMAIPESCGPVSGARDRQHSSADAVGWAWASRPTTIVDGTTAMTAASAIQPIRVDIFNVFS